MKKYFNNIRLLSASQYICCKLDISKADKICYYLEVGYINSVYIQFLILIVSVVWWLVTYNMLAVLAIYISVVYIVAHIIDHLFVSSGVVTSFRGCMQQASYYRAWLAIISVILDFVTIVYLFFAIIGKLLDHSQITLQLFELPAVLIVSSSTIVITAFIMSIINSFTNAKLFIYEKYINSLYSKVKDGSASIDEVITLLNIYGHCADDENSINYNIVKIKKLCNDNDYSEFNMVFNKMLPELIPLIKLEATVELTNSQWGDIVTLVRNNNDLISNKINQFNERVLNAHTEKIETLYSRAIKDAKSNLSNLS